MTQNACLYNASSDRRVFWKTARRHHTCVASRPSESKHACSGDTYSRNIAHIVNSWRVFLCSAGVAPCRVTEHAFSGFSAWKRICYTVHKWTPEHCLRAPEHSLRFWLSSECQNWAGLFWQECSPSTFPQYWPPSTFFWGEIKQLLKFAVVIVLILGRLLFRYWLPVEKKGQLLATSVVDPDQYPDPTFKLVSDPVWYPT